MFSFEKIKNSSVVNSPWPYILVDDLLTFDTAIQLSKKMQDEFDWYYDDHPDAKGCIRLSDNTEYFENFASDQFCKTLIAKLGYELPSKYRLGQSNTWHTQGASLPVHTDMHCLKGSNKKYGENFTMCVTYQLYLPDSTEFEHTGLWMHNENKDDNGQRTKIKQLPCMPGVFFAYVNTDKSYHSVPEQEEAFNRVSHMGRIFW